MTEEHVVEPRDKLHAQVLDMHRGLTSLIDKLGMLDTQNQRIEACTDPELKLVMAHQRDATRKHIAMLFEWVRRRDPKLDKEMKEALFKAGPIAAQYHYEE
ncbi:ferritin family protein [Massilia endophytica]|uniref:ferritin family protein n=1 Tax=Massilia endophytica TaxID=2899220 RepID=UPI001E3C5411|nr:ferritin [Massilia endophytica]UGQ44722.1 ferritin [Massilia endophytica]